MRRPVMYLAGLLLATGASLALAGPASAAPSNGPCHHGNHYMNGWDDDDDWFYYNHEYNHNSGNTVNGIALLNHWGDSSGLIPIL